MRLAIHTSKGKVRVAINPYTGQTVYLEDVNGMAEVVGLGTLDCIFDEAVEEFNKALNAVPTIKHNSVMNYQKWDREQKR